MLKYTICFIKRGEKILLLNREKSAWMGVWNGVGGKIEANETPIESVLREVKEETGITLMNAEYKGKVTWTDGSTYFGGMYAYIAELPESYEYHTPIKVEEGILDWKEISWILHPQNMGIAGLKNYLAKMLNEQTIYEYQFTYKDDEIIKFKTSPIEQPIMS